MDEGRLETGSLAEGVSEGSRVRSPVISRAGNNWHVTLARQMARAARPTNTPAESG